MNENLIKFIVSVVFIYIILRSNSRLSAAVSRLQPLAFAIPFNVSRRCSAFHVVKQGKSVGLRFNWFSSSCASIVYIFYKVRIMSICSLSDISRLFFRAFQNFSLLLASSVLFSKTTCNFSIFGL